MLNAIVEMFMTEYYLIKAVLGKHIGDGEELFKALGKIFLISAKDAKRLYRLAENERTKSIVTEKDFMQFLRIRQYSLLIGSSLPENAEWEETALLKGNAILIAKNNNLLPVGDAFVNSIYNSLTTAAAKGLIIALRIIGILQCEGIFFAKNEKVGISHLSRAADWNDAVSTLALLSYRKDKREFNMLRLRSEIAGTPVEKLYAVAAKEYGEVDEVNAAAVGLLNKAFNAGVLKSEIYDSKYARILYGAVLQNKDKEKMVLTLNKESLSLISGLPLKLTNENNIKIETPTFGGVAVKRDGEISKISNVLKNSDLRYLESFRPLCLCCESRYVLKMYAKAISENESGIHFEMFDFAELSEYDLEPTPNNVFVRNIDEDKDNRFLIFFCGEISEHKMDAVKNFLQSGSRAKFRLINPGVTLDLSPVLPVCFCDKQNVQHLKQYCDIIQLDDIMPDELSAAVNDVIRNKKRDYGVHKIKFSADVKDVFRGYDIDTAEKIIDSALRARRGNGVDLKLSRELLREFSNVNEQPRIGFGGTINV